MEGEEKAQLSIFQFCKNAAKSLKFTRNKILYQLKFREQMANSLWRILYVDLMEKQIP